MDRISCFSLRRLCHSEIFIAIMLIIAVTALFLPVMVGWRGIFHDDLARESFPRYYFFAYNLQRSIIPLWDPYTWCGAIPFYAQYLSETYYICLWPFFFLANLNDLTHCYWLFILLPLWLHYILGAGGMFVFLRRLIGCSRFSSYFGALAYVFSPCFIYAHVWPQAIFALAWLPCLLTIYASAVKKWQIWKIVAGGLIFAFILTSGQITYWHFVILLWGVVALFMIISQSGTDKNGAVKTALLVAFLICIIGIGLSSVYLFSFVDGRQYTQEHIELTLNAALSRDPANLPPFYLATLLIPNLFFNITGVNMLDIIPDEIYFWEANMSGGMAVSLLVMLALILALTVPLSNFKDWQRRWWTVVFSCIYLFAVLCTLGRHTPFYRYVIGFLPGIKTLPFPVRYRMLQCFAVAILTPIALDYLTTSSFILQVKSHLRRWVWIYIIFSFFIVIAALSYSLNYCKYKVFDNRSESTISTTNSHSSVGGGTGRHSSPHFIIGKMSGILQEMQNSLSLKGGLLRLFREEESFRKQIVVTVLYWLLISAAIILGLYYLSPKRFGYFLGVVALMEFFVFGAGAFYGSGYGWYTGKDIPQRDVRPLDHPIVQQMVEPLTTVATNSTLRIATLVPYFDNYVRLKGRSALMGFGMHPIETRFKRAFEAAYGRPVDWDYYDKPHKPIHIPFLNHFSVGYFLSRDPNNIFLGGTTISLPGRLPRLFIYINPNALPRAFTLDRVIVASEEEQLNQLVSGDLRQAVYVSSSKCFPSRESNIDKGDDFVPHFANLQQFNRISRLNLDNPNRIEIDIEVSKPAMLVLTEVWYPGWEANINGQSIPIYRVNYCQRGLWLEKGRHKVQFRFRPLAWRWGMGISLGTIILLVFLLVIYQVRKIIR